MQIVDPEAQAILDAVRERLDLIRKTNPQEAGCYFDCRILELPDLVERYERLLHPDKREPRRFWNYVKSLNRRTSLRLVKTLEELFNKAKLLEPGPLAKLLEHDVTPPLSVAEKARVGELQEHLAAKPNEVPTNLEHYDQILERISSALVSNIARHFLLTSRGRREMARLRYLDFYWQHRSWRDRYEATAAKLWELAEALDHPPFETTIRRLLYDDSAGGIRVPLLAERLKWSDRDDSRKRQMDRRAKKTLRNR